MAKNNNSNVSVHDAEAMSWMASVNKKFGLEVVKLGEFEKPPALIPFSSPRLNYMSYGGVPRGRWIEFYGDESSGKSSVSLDVLANFQKLYPDERALYVDVENTYNPIWAGNMGVDSSKVIHMKCNGQYAEQIFDLIQSAMENISNLGMVILDSIGAMVSKQATEKSYEEKTYGGIAMPLTVFVNKCTPIISRENICFIGINQTRENIGNMYNPITTPGGKAWKFGCSQRFMFRKGKFLDDKGNEISNSSENPAGHLIEVKLVKSKVCPSDRRVSKCCLMYLSGVRVDLDIFDLALKFNIIEKAGAWFYYNNKELKWNGAANVLAYLNENDEFRQRIEDQINSYLLNNGDTELEEEDGTPMKEI